MDSIKSLSIVNKVLFPAPEASYSPHWTDLPGELLWIPTPFVSIATKKDNEKEIENENENEKEKENESEKKTSSTKLSSSNGTFSRRKKKSQDKEKDNLSFFPAQYVAIDGSDKIMIYSHGNGCDVGQMSETIAAYARYFVINVIALEYPGYGPCGGTPSESGCNQNMRATYDFVTKELGFKPENVIIFGRSIGTGVATELVSSLESEGVTVGALVLQSPYLSVKTLAKSLVGMAAKLIMDRFENIKKIPKVRCPLLIIHGDQDQLIPYQHAEKLHELATVEIKRLVIAEGADHNYFNEELHVFKPIRQHLKAVYGKKYWQKDTLVRVDAPQVYKEIPTNLEKDTPTSGGVWSSLFASSVALVEGSSAISKGDDTVRLDASTIEKN